MVLLSRQAKFGRYTAHGVHAESDVLIQIQAQAFGAFHGMSSRWTLRAKALSFIFLRTLLAVDLGERLTRLDQQPRR